MVALVTADVSCHNGMLMLLCADDGLHDDSYQCHIDALAEAVAASRVAYSCP
jgi:hypothetical protein